MSTVNDVEVNSMDHNESNRNSRKRRLPSKNRNVPNKKAKKKQQQLERIQRRILSRQSFITKYMNTFNISEKDEAVHSKFITAGKDLAEYLSPKHGITDTTQLIMTNIALKTAVQHNTNARDLDSAQYSLVYTKRLQSEGIDPTKLHKTIEKLFISSSPSSFTLQKRYSVGNHEIFGTPLEDCEYIQFYSSKEEQSSLINMINALITSGCGVTEEGKEKINEILRTKSRNIRLKFRKPVLDILESIEVERTKNKSNFMQTAEDKIVNVITTKLKYPKQKDYWQQLLWAKRKRRIWIATMSQLPRLQFQLYKNK